VLGLVLCASILGITIFEKFAEGGWVPLLVTAIVVALCERIRAHYAWVGRQIRAIDSTLADIPTPPEALPPPPLDPRAPTVALLVGRYGGLGIHAFLSVLRMYPGFYKNFIFVSVSVVDVHALQGKEELDEVARRTRIDLEKYVALANRFGFAARIETTVGTEVVDEVGKIATRLKQEFPRVHFFAGRLVFSHEGWYYRLLHNETAAQIERRLQAEGIAMLTVPIRVRDHHRSRGRPPTPTPLPVARAA
jgi:hypothetical protein